MAPSSSPVVGGMRSSPGSRSSSRPSGRPGCPACALVSFGDSQELRCREVLRKIGLRREDGGMTTANGQSDTGSALTHLECTNCFEVFDADVAHGLCPACGKVLHARYDLDSVVVTPEELGRRETTMWRYREVLPVRRAENVVSLGEGCTPLLRVPRLAAALGIADLRVKDEGQNPTASFKARGMAAAVSRARELDIDSVATPSAGNAAGALATYAARAGLREIGRVHV